MQVASSRLMSLRVGGADIVDLGPCIANPTGALSHEPAVAVVAALERSGVAIIVGHGVAPALVKPGRRLHEGQGDASRLPLREFFVGH